MTEYSIKEASQMVRESGKKYKLFYYNVFGWDVYFTLEPTFATPSGELKNFPRRVRIYADQTVGVV